jgi:hypothetical protein
MYDHYLSLEREVAFEGEWIHKGVLISRELRAKEVWESEGTDIALEELRQAEKDNASFIPPTTIEEMVERIDKVNRMIIESGVK